METEKIIILRKQEKDGLIQERILTCVVGRIKIKSDRRRQNRTREKDSIEYDMIVQDRADKEV